MNPNPNIIPPMTHELSPYWDQPPVAEILIDDKNALMSKDTLEQLHDYSHSQPTGAYEGKMWRTYIGHGDPAKDQRDGAWMLCWFGFCDNPDRVSNNYREIILI